VSDAELLRRIRQLEEQRRQDEITRETIRTWAVAGLIAALIWKAYQ